ncbi:ATP-binding protein [Streptomyces nanshensis]|uniref:Histidine kinase/HSP90-like ATPase domain-containing protein n=1 Tax=Streptomyces nanshensis TaxID=518642 RepID=A0A1E7L603_9ACTN|nr:ATP-binding protein [Streptomyces nanshensis]OEV11443.1 hypothetical protein AN218_13010 [Streptomyces nanshensis]
MPTYRRTFPEHADQVGHARRWTRDVLAGCPSVQDAVLIVSELGTNAVTHTTSPDFRVTTCVDENTVTISVTDRGDSVSAPHLAKPYGNGTHGRGLAIVSQLTSAVHVSRTVRGRTVAARLTAEAVPAC